MNIIHNEEKKAFIACTDNNRHIGQISYVFKPGTIVATHTRVSSEFQGQGIGSKLLDALVAYAKEQKRTVTPQCSYVLSEFQKHPEKYSSVEEFSAVVG